MATNKSNPKPDEPSVEHAIDGIVERIHEARNFDFRNYKRATLRRRIEHRMRERNCATVADYAAALERDPSEFDALLSAMLIKVTSFFRDAEMWEALSTKWIPQILQEKRPGEEIRVWSAGCATGEEAFSVAILLAEALGAGFNNQDIKVFGTDVDERAIAHAGRGLYTHRDLESVPKAILRSGFVEEAGGWSVRREIRRSVVFGVNNLVSDAPISRLDLLFCRNVFIYLDTTLQKRVLTRFHYALRRHGVLVLGKSELIPFAARIYEPLDLSRRIYRKDGHRDGAVAQERLVGLLEQEVISRDGMPSTREVGTVEQFHRDVVQSMQMPVLATQLDGTVTYWNPAAVALWQRSESEVTGKKLPSLALPGLSGDVLSEKSQAIREGRSARELGYGTLTLGGRARQLAIEISALKDHAGAAVGLIYIARDVTGHAEQEAELQRANEERGTAVEELRSLNEEMQSSNEELETTNEELQSANEELQTTNEELQSTNEELETTNEELQSTNAELDATNHELAHRTEEMNRLALHQRTIIRSLSAAVIVLDVSGRITVWNLAAERLLGLAEGEALGQLLWTLPIPALARTVMGKARKALAQNLGLRAEEVEYELPTGAKGSAMIAAVPILDGGNQLGAVILFEDCTRLASLGAELARLKGRNGRAHAKEG